MFRHERRRLEYVRSLSFLLGADLSLGEAMAAGGLDFDRTSRLLQAGIPFAEALRGSGLGFAESEIAILKAGELTGDLAVAASALATMLARDLADREKILEVLAYPCSMILFAAVSAAGAGLVSATGAMGEASAGAGWPALLASGGTMLFLGLLCGAALGFSRMMARGGPARDKALALAFSLPRLGAALRAREIHRFCLIARFLTEARLPFLSALRSAEAGLSSPELRRAAEGACGLLRNGRPPSEAFALAGGFPGELARWFALAERTGDPAKAFSMLEAYFGHEADRLARAAVALVEPLSLLVAGGLVAASLAGLVATSLSASLAGLTPP
ncbi:MAG: type II secretion system F family protein [Spirochaetaceae bacterium]|nr:type II secretion system F family protein [Spirochaetaceae bacterium]